MGELIRAADSYLYRHQPWGVQFAIDRHVEALHAVGELVIFTMMWQIQDFEAGLVERCLRCYETNREAQAFNQVPTKKCPECFGTTFVGGFRAQIIRPALVDDRDEEVEETSKGMTRNDSVAVETMGDFTIHKGDYMFRSDGQRFQVEEKGEDVMRTGFQSPASDRSFTGSIPAAHLEDPTSVAYMIPPVGLDGIINTLTPVVTDNFIPTYTDFDLLRPNGYR